MQELALTNKAPRAPTMNSRILALCFMVALLSGCDFVDKVDKRLMRTDVYFDIKAKANDAFSTRSNAVRFEGDSMIAGINYDKKSETVRAVYDWNDDFKSPDVNGVSGAPLEVVLTGIAPKKSPVIIIFAGFNNIKHVEQSEESIADKYSKIISRSRQLSDKVICIGVPPMIHNKSESWYPEGALIANSRIISIDSKISDLCGNGYIDTPNFWTDSDSDDGIHPNRQGFSKIVARLKEKVPAEYLK